MEEHSLFQKQMKQIFLETSKFFQRLSDIFDDNLDKLLAEKGRQPKEQKATKQKNSTKNSKADNEKNGGKASKQKKQKAEKDPNAPKKPLTAFMLYTNARRPDVTKKSPGVKITEISSLIGNEWNDLTEDEKNIWREKSKDEKLMYELKLYNYQKEQKMDDKTGPGEGLLEEGKELPEQKDKAKETSAMNALSGTKRKRSDDDESSIDSSSEDNEAKQKNKRHKEK